MEVRPGPGKRLVVSCERLLASVSAWSLAGHAAQEEASHGDVDHGLEDIEALLEVADETARSDQPAERAFDGSPAGSTLNRPGSLAALRTSVARLEQGAPRVALRKPSPSGIPSAGCSLGMGFVAAPSMRCSPPVNWPAYDASLRRAGEAPPCAAARLLALKAPWSETGGNVRIVELSGYLPP
jgi:hypothetical protein